MLSWSRSTTRDSDWQAFPRASAGKKAGGGEGPTASSRRDWEWRQENACVLVVHVDEINALKGFQRSLTRSVSSETNPPTSQVQSGVRLAKAPCKS